MNSGKLLGLLGYAEVKVTGKFPEKFINLANMTGVRMWDTALNDDVLTFKTDLYSLDKLWTVHHKSGCTMEVSKKAGLMVIGKFLLKRKILLAGFFCFCFTLYYLAGLVWSINIEGVENLDQTKILGTVEEFGLERWSRVRNLDLNDIEDQLYIIYPEIAWVAIDRKGTSIHIRIVEKEQDPLQSGKPIDIVAAYDGIISEMMILQGVPMVEPGMTVAKNDVLIAGYSDTEGLVHAAGTITAVIYIEGYGESWLQEIEETRTGNMKQINYLQVGGRNIALSRQNHGFDHYQMEEQVRYIRGNSSIPIRLLEQRYYEIELHVFDYTPQEAAEIAQERALISAHNQVKEHFDIISKSVNDITIEDNIFRFKVLLEVEGNIGKEAQSKGD